jgi:hypothetical protein
MDPELWGPSSQRLTIFIHPGRIKRGLAFREQAGPVLKPGKRYSLVIDDGLRDMNGQPLASPHEKHFVVTDADRTSPDPAGWLLSVPGAGSRDPLHVVFGEPMDHALLGRFVTVRHASGRAVGGRVMVSQQETVWEYVPDGPWTAGSYVVVVDTAIEDLAGNQIGRLFDVDTSQGRTEPALGETVSVPFTIETAATQ